MASTSDDVVVVTGGNGGIGLAIARSFCADGGSVSIWARNAEKLERAAEELSALPGVVHVARCDVSVEADVEQAFATTVDCLGPVTAVFANAGVNGGGQQFPTTELAEWRRVMGTNLEGAFMTLRAGARHMIEHGQGGALVGVASLAAHYGSPRNAAYSASKAGLIALTRTLAVELARYGVRSNALVPGWTRDTEMTDRLQSNQRFIDVTTRRIPVRRWAIPSDMLPAARFLADRRATYHTGQTVVVDGGYTAF